METGLFPTPCDLHLNTNIFLENATEEKYALDNLFNEAKKKMAENAGFQNFNQFSSALDSSTLI